MRLKRLELYGFKSFAARTVFEFGDGIAAVIGPNGSGKSNISDAIRWVMGEQSYNTLRAKSTEDMIFAGTGGRARMGLAEVLITIDNSEGILPLEYSEVVVGRRAHRSGENEYLLNGTQVRYRDVLDILSGAGLARSKYTVIGQGMVDAALALRPDARRALFEEASGVSAHLRKREETLRRIQETERNLERVRDILQELVPRGRTLRRQAERAEEAQLLRRDLEELQRIWYGYQWQRRQRALVRAEEQLTSQVAALQVHRTRAAEMGSALATLDEQRLARERAIAELSTRLEALRAEADAYERENAIAQERARLIAQQQAGLAAETQALASRREVLAQEVARSAEELARQEEAVAVARALLAAAQEEAAVHQAARVEVEREASSVEARLGNLGRSLSAQRARSEQLGERHDRLLADRQEAAEEQARLQELLARLEERSAELSARVAAVERVRQETAARLAGVEEEIGAARGQLAAAEEELARLGRQKDGLASRYELLGRLRQEMTGFHPGVRAALSPRAGLRGILGTVVNLMTVPAELAEAIESALGSRLQNVVTETWEDAAAAIDYLKRQRGGWATFLPIDTVRGRPPLRLQRQAGVVGVASELVQYEDRLSPVFEMLLGSVVIVDDLAAARRLLRTRTSASLYVTLEGETVQPSGALSGGTRQRNTNLLAQEQEWQALPQQIAALERSVAEAAARAEAQAAALGELRASARALEAEGARQRQLGEAAERAAGAHAAEIREAQRDSKWRASRLAQAEKELGELLGRQQRLRDELSVTEADHEATLARSAELRTRLEAVDDRQARQRLAELETRAAVSERTVQSQRVLVESHRHNLQQLDEQIAAKETQGQALAQDAAEIAAQLAAAQGRQAEVARRLEALTARLEPARDALAGLSASRREAEAARTRAVERLHEAELAQSRAALECERAREELASLTEDIEANLGPMQYPDETTHQLRLSLGDDVVVLPQIDTIPPGLSDQIRQLRVRLRRLGNVNPDAPQEYEQLLDRQTFLETQEADLRGAIASLHEVIEEFDAVIERDFGNTVRAVDVAFGEYFRRLFDGGSAQLVLTDADDLSTSGVDILARPPGKRLQNLSLLSGGERALTAVALLFALLKANPVPFCCLDEVDAALDESNVQRFRTLLMEHARSTQFVVITHNRHTIEAATTIYGISMGERGVSESISLKLPEDGAGDGGASGVVTAPANGRTAEAAVEA